MFGNLLSVHSITALLCMAFCSLVRPSKVFPYLQRSTVLRSTACRHQRPSTIALHHQRLSFASMMATDAASSEESKQQQQRQPVVVVLAGPTAVGKSDVAAKLCADHNGIIVSADSVQAYRGVQIGANKPTKEEMEATPHLLIDVADADNAYNAAEWTQDAVFCIQNLTGRRRRSSEQKHSDAAPVVDEETLQRWRQLEDSIHHARSIKGVTETDPVLPVVVGGTMMYVQWLVHGRPDAMRPTKRAADKALSIMHKFEAAHDFEGAVGVVSAFGQKFVQQIEKLCGRDWCE